MNELKIAISKMISKSIAIIF